MGTPGTLWFVYGAIAAGLVLAAAGAWLARRGLRPRRVGRTPHCPNCDYVLTGLVAEGPGGSPTRCPECGTAVSAGLAARGDRPARMARGWVGVAMLLLGLGVAGVVGVGALRGVDWYRWRPTGWVIGDMRTADGPRHLRAWGEIERRVAEGSFSESDRAALDRAVVDTVLIDGVRYQGAIDYAVGRYGRMDPAERAPLLDRWLSMLASGSLADAQLAADALRPVLVAPGLAPADADRVTHFALAHQPRAASLKWRVADDLLLDWLGERAAKRLLSDADQKRFFEQAIALELAVRPLVGEGDRTPYEVRDVGHSPTEGGWWSSYEELSVAVDGRTVVERSGMGYSAALHGTTYGRAVDPAGVGRHTVTVVVRQTVSHRDDHPPGTSYASDKLVLRFAKEYRLTGAFEVLPKRGASPVRWVDDPALADRLKAAIRPQQTQVRDPAEWGEHWFRTVLVAKELPVGVAFRVFARIGGREYDVGTLTATTGGWTSFSVGSSRETPRLPAGVTVGRVDLILRSDEATARQTVEMHEVWRGELVYERVEFERR